MKKILIFPSGTEIAFEILNALKYSKFVEIYGGTSVSDHSDFVYKNLIRGFPFVTEPGFLDFLNDVIDKEKIDCIYPAHDNACMVLSEYASKIHAQVIVTDYNTVRICRSKAETYRIFKEERFIPIIYDSVDGVKEYPVFVKPEIGQGAIGAKKIESEYDLKEALRKDKSLIICEYLPGMEYTVDCFTDRYGRLRVVKLRSRERIKTGISVRSQLIELDNEINTIAEIINSRLKFQGVWFFQVKQDKSGEYRLMEISPRIPGTIGVSRNLGINFAILTLFDFWGYDVDIIDNKYDITTDRAFYSAYKINYEYKHVYLDFDDTLVIKGKVNADLIKYLYQAKNMGKKLHILSKHIGNIYKELEKYNISESLFEDIFMISLDEEKETYIKEKDSIFIDDSFEERMKVFNRCKIPVFDMDMIEALIDWRM